MQFAVEPGGGYAAKFGLIRTNQFRIAQFCLPLSPRAKAKLSIR